MREKSGSATPSVRYVDELAREKSLRHKEATLDAIIKPLK
jgi:hypothetical protein